MALLEVENLKTYFKTESGVVRAVDGISFEVERGETVGLVGESGAGKTVAIRSILGLINDPGRIVEGSIRFDGTDLTTLSEKELRQEVRGSEISMIFQDAMSALDPVHTVGEQIAEIIEHHQDVSSSQALEQTVELLDDVGIPDPEERVDQYPHEFSGGMQQRAVIAMALSCNPQLIIADEPTTALDVTIQTQIIELLRDIQDEYDTAMVYVTHDLGVVREMCDRVQVMYLGEIVERASYEELYENPKHPYTQALFQSVVTADRTVEDLSPIEGTMPSAVDPPSGCKFHTRCPVSFEDCQKVSPKQYRVDENHDAACLLYDAAVERPEPSIDESGDEEAPQ